MSVRHSSLDARFVQAEASQRLQDFLHVAKQNRDIAEWLYSDSPQSQRAEGILSPETFTRSVAVGTIQSYTDLGVPLTSERTSTYSETFIYDLFVPVKEVDGVGVGYSFHTGTTRTGCSFVSQDIFPILKTNRGRYVYNKDEKSLLILRENTTNTDVVIYIHWTSHTRRQVCYCVVPHQQYTFENHPQTVICSGASFADCLCPSSQRRVEKSSLRNVFDNTVDDTLPNGPADFVNGDWKEDNINSLPQCMFHDLDNEEDIEDRYYRDSLAWVNEHQKRSLLGRQTKGLVQFESKRRRYERCDPPISLFEGNFFSAHVIRDAFGECGRLEKRLAFEVRTSTTIPKADCMNLLRKVAAQVYYSFVLWASTDQCLVVAQEHVAAELLWGKDGKLCDE